MMAASGKMEQEPSEIELLLPWHAAGTLSARDSRRIDEALARDPKLARQYAIIREEYAETIDLNESLGAPSARAMQNLFAAIDAEPAHSPPSPVRGLTSRFAGFFASLSPRTLVWSASLGALVLILQAGVIGTILMNRGPASFQTASLSNNETITRDIGAITLPHAQVRFTPDARIADVTALLDRYQVSIAGSSKGGMFRLQFNTAMSKDEFASLLGRLRSEKIVSLATAAP